MNSTITTSIEETFEYRHKKFDQFKHLRHNSTSSSTDEYECIKVEIERLEERPYSQSSSEMSSTYANSQWSASAGTLNSSPRPTAYKRSSPDSTYSATESYSTQLPPAAKRMRTTSSSDSTYSVAFSPLLTINTQRHSSIPFVAPSTTTRTPFVATGALTPTAAILPKISDETLRSICKYHGNMVRKYPKKERTPKDQERRNKNTIACRMSRRVKKLEHVAIEEQYKEFSQQTFAIIEQSMKATAYLHELMRLSAVANGSDGQVPSLESQAELSNLDEKPLSAVGQKKPFTIAFLAGNEE